MTEETALVFEIEKFAVHDGPGIRTVVFLKGCPLRCQWCHNPESQSFKPELMFNSAKCVGCGWCVSVCPNHCHKIVDGRHILDRVNCVGCGKCTEKCYADALELVGKTMSVSQVLAEVMKDKPFYDNSGGGITISGGEPLAHFEFTLALLKAAKEKGLHTAVETSGFAPQEKIDALRSVVDLWLWDAKATPDRHAELIGVSADTILENLTHLDASGAKIILRCPMVPGVNDDDASLLYIAELANARKNIQEIDLEPYHPLGEGKSERLGRNNIFRSAFAPEESKKYWREFLQMQTKLPVHI